LIINWIATVSVMLMHALVVSHQWLNYITDKNRSI
jgi:hypothetical protein